MKKDQKSTGSKKSLTKSMSKNDSKERLLKKSPSSKKNLKLKGKKGSKKGKSSRGSPSPDYDDTKSVRTMKEIEFQKEKYMSSRKVSDLIKVAGGITLFDRHEVTKGPEANISSRHMSIKDFNL